MSRRRRAVVDLSVLGDLFRHLDGVFEGEERYLDAVQRLLRAGDIAGADLCHRDGAECIGATETVAQALGDVDRACGLAGLGHGADDLRQLLLGGDREPDIVRRFHGEVDRRPCAIAVAEPGEGFRHGGEVVHPGDGQFLVRGHHQGGGKGAVATGIREAIRDRVRGTRQVARRPRRCRNGGKEAENEQDCPQERENGSGHPRSPLRAADEPAGADAATAFSDSKPLNMATVSPSATPSMV